MSSDPLALLPVEKWPELKSLFKADWPRSILGYMTLEFQECLLRSGVDYGFKVYCPYGEVKYGMVAVNIKDTYHELLIQCPQDDASKLEQAMKTTDIVDWSKVNQMPFIPDHVKDCILRLYHMKNLKLDPEKNLTQALGYVLDKEAPLYGVRLPPGFSFDLLSLDSIPVINKTWPHRYPGSEWYFELLINAKLGYGLYNGKELLAWVVLREIGALGHLYTLESHRRKGYGELVVKLISNMHLKDKKYTVAYCVASNTNAANMYDKLGFKILVASTWIENL